MLRKYISLLLSVILIFSCFSAQAAGFAVETAPETDAETLLRGYSKGEGYLYVNFGNFPYTKKKGDSSPVLWRVLSVENDYAYLMTEYCIDGHRWHSVKKDLGSWKEYEMYEYMNFDLVDRLFSAKEKDIVRYSDELGWLFIPSAADFMNLDYGFRPIRTKIEPERECAMTPYASSIAGTHVDANGKCTYWTRSCRNAAVGGYQWIIGYNGHMSMSGYLRVNAIRAACYVDLTRLDHAKGSGTLRDPYVFEIVP